MLTIVTFLAAIAAIGAVPLAGLSVGMLFLSVTVYGGFSLPLYSVCIAHGNDYLEPEQMVGASGALVLANGIGSVIGPITVSLLMAVGGANAFFIFLAVVHAALGVFALYRMTRRSAPPLEQQGTYAPRRPPFDPGRPGASS